MIDTREVRDFLAQRRIAVVGASSDPKSFGNVIHRELREHGYDAVAVARSSPAADVTTYASLAQVPGPVDGVIVMVGADHSAAVVRECIELGIRRVWLFKGLGGPGALSDEAVALCRKHGIEVIEGACPLMFLEPVGWFHRLHRAARHLNHSLSKAS